MATAGRPSSAKGRFELSSSPTSTARPSIGSMASFETSTPGTRRSTCNLAISSICRPSSASTSGKKRKGGARAASSRPEPPVRRKILPIAALWGICAPFHREGEKSMHFRMLTLATASFLAVAAAPGANAAKPVYGDWGYETSAMDRSVKPGDDFWAYVNGSWDRKTQIAADRASAGPFITLSDDAERDVRQIVEGLANDPNRDLLGQQIGDFYSSFMDEAAIEAAGTTPLKPYLSEIDAAKTRSQLLTLFEKPGFASPFDLGIDADFKKPEAYSAFASQATLGMPSREYYLEDNAKMKAHRAAYRNYILTVQKLAGLPGGEASADRIIALETALSKVQWPAADRRDIDKIFNPMNRVQLAKLAPQFAWAATLQKAGLGTATSVIVTEPSAVAGAGKILASTPLSTWKEWLAFRFASDHAAYLPKALDDAHFNFYSKELSGVEQQR